MKSKSIITLFLSVLILNHLSLKAQEDCFYFDETTMLAYNTIDSTLYSGQCLIKDKRFSCLAYYEKGELLYQMIYKKNGKLIDSIELNGGFNLTELSYYNSGNIRYKGSYTTDRKNDFNYPEGYSFHYRRNGLLKEKRNYYLDEGKSKYYSILYYKNENIKREGAYVTDTTNQNSIVTLKQDGVHKYYKKNGYLHKTNYIQKRYSYTTVYNKDGSIKHESKAIIIE